MWFYENFCIFVGDKAMNIFKRTYIWCKRFRYRKGYGVHSPFAFSLMQDVIHERRTYYAYRDLRWVRKEAPAQLPRYPQRIDKLLFRLVNYLSPAYVLEVGTGSGISLHYLAAGRRGAQVVSLCGPEADERVLELTASCPNAELLAGNELDLLAEELRLHEVVDFLHVAHTEHCREVVARCLDRVDGRSLFVIEGIHRTSDKLAWWKELQEDARTGITFDLYELGLIFFDKTKYKQHYVVNF